MALCLALHLISPPVHIIREVEAKTTKTGREDDAMMFGAVLFLNYGIVKGIVATETLIMHCTAMNNYRNRSGTNFQTLSSSLQADRIEKGTRDAMRARSRRTN